MSVKGCGYRPAGHDRPTLKGSAASFQAWQARCIVSVFLHGERYWKAAIGMTERPSARESISLPLPDKALFSAG